ncbi:amino acid permease family protein [Mycobacterium kansasii]|uniref:Amino acid permease family protein n=1 Tax=Mycobacterium kansasii TaxID=1768 RepID=A0A1V3XDR2_MYCKA|nr:amino acid permease family protein [Mycobacterium kansasii]
MSPWANFSLGFTYLSPVVGIYTVFAFALATAGPPMIWSLLIVGAGQMLVALVFSEVVAQFPVAGGVYPWARRLWGRKWAWMTGWVYMFCLLALIADAAFGAGRMWRPCSASRRPLKPRSIADWPCWRWRP